VRSELAAVEDPRERRRFARAVVVVVVARRTLTAWFIVLHLLFWLPGIVLGAGLGTRSASEGVNRQVGT